VIAGKSKGVWLKASVALLKTYMRMFLSSYFLLLQAFCFTHPLLTTPRSFFSLSLSPSFPCALPVRYKNVAVVCLMGARCRGVKILALDFSLLAVHRPHVCQ